MTRLQWKLISVRLEIVLIVMQIGAWFAPNVLLGEWVLSNLVSIHLDMVLVSEQDRCTLCAKHAIDSEIILDAPNGTLG